MLYKGIDNKAVCVFLFFVSHNPSIFAQNKNVTYNVEYRGSSIISLSKNLRRHHNRPCPSRTIGVVIGSGFFLFFFFLGKRNKYKNILSVRLHLWISIQSLKKKKKKKTVLLYFIVLHFRRPK